MIWRWWQTFAAAAKEAGKATHCTTQALVPCVFSFCKSIGTYPGRRSVVSRMDVIASNARANANFFDIANRKDGDARLFD